MNTTVRKSQKIKSLLSERASLVARLQPLAEKRDLNPDEQAAMDDLVAQVQDLDARVTVLEAEEAGEDDEGTGMEDGTTPDPDKEQPSTQPAENNLKLSAMEKRIKSLEALALVGRGRRSAPVPPGTGPGYVRDLNDRQATRDKDLCIRGWALAGRNAITDQHRAAAERQNFDLNSSSLKFQLFNSKEQREFRKNRKVPETRAMSEGVLLGNGSAGGYLVPTGFLAELEKTLLMYANLREVARVIRTDTGNPIQVPTVDDTSNSGALVAENVQFPQQDVAVGQKTLQAFLFTSQQVNVSISLMQDSAIDIPSMMGELLGERLGRSQQSYFTTGTGTSQPEGCLTSATAGITAASATAIAVDDLTQTLHSLDRAYRNNAVWMMHDQILLAIRRLKNSFGEPIFTESYMVGEPDRLYGLPVFINQGMPNSIASGTKSVLIGDFEKSIFIRDAMEVEIVRLNERYADYGQVAFVALMRSDSRVIQPKGMKYLVH